MLSPLLALLLLAEGERPAPAWIHCTPTTIEVAGGRVRRAQHPIARALEEAGPGSVVFLDPGTYRPFTIGMGNGRADDAVTRGGDPYFPIVLDGGGAARIVGEGDAIAIDQRRENGWITFRDLTIVPGRRSGVIFYRQPPERMHRGYSFEDCHVLGSFDHATGNGAPSKWGVSAHSVADFRFVGLREPARIERIEKEHAFYVQNPRGPVTIENVRASRLGRTFCQFTARAREGPPGRGDVTIRRCEVSDVGLAAGDAHKGGFAFTFAGRLRGTILLEENTYRAGFDPFLTKLTRAGQPYGTGAFVAWQAGEPEPNAALILRDNRFLFAEGCGDRPVVQIGGCERVVVAGENEFRSGGTWPALSLDPVGEGGRTTSSPNGSVYLAPLTVLGGGVTLRGKEATEAELAKLRLR